MKKDSKYVLWSKPESSYNPAPQPCVSKTHLSCARCYRTFKVEKHYQMYCSEECEKILKEKMAQIKEDRLNGNCIKCGLQFRRTAENSTVAICYSCKKYKIKMDTKSAKACQPVKEKKPRKKISYEELIRRSEHERVWKDAGWSHYLKGRKWDRI